MIATILLVTLAFYWLLIETDCLRIQLEAYETIEQFDKRILIGMEAEFEVEYGEPSGTYFAKYEKWLKKRYAPTYVSLPEPQIDRRDKWMQIEDDLQARRSGSMIYQRGQMAETLVRRYLNTHKEV